MARESLEDASFETLMKALEAVTQSFAKNLPNLTEKKEVTNNLKTKLHILKDILELIQRNYPLRYDSQLKKLYEGLIKIYSNNESGVLVSKSLNENEKRALLNSYRNTKWEFTTSYMGNKYTKKQNPNAANISKRSKEISLRLKHILQILKKRYPSAMTPDMERNLEQHTRINPSGGKSRRHMKRSRRFTHRRK